MNPKTKFKQTEIGMIPEDWEVKALGEVAEVIMGQSPPGESYNNKGEGIKFLQGVKTFGEKYPSFDTYTTQMTKKAKAGSILLSVRAPVGEVNITREDLCIGRGLATLNMRNGNNEFLYYLLKKFSSYIIGRETGSVFGSINSEQIKNLELPFPDIHEQRAIAKILSDLDSKIELNHQMNKTLEAIGQAIFKHWFIEFEFPNEEGKPYKSSGGEMVYNEELGKEIPKGWRVGRLGDFIDQIESGSRPKGGSTESGIPSIGAENILGLGIYDYSSTKYVPEDFYENMIQGKIKDFDVLFYKDGAQLGRTSIFGLGFPFEKCCINEHVFIIRVRNPLTQIYLYFWSTLPSVKNDIINLNTNSAQPGITKEGVKSLNILTPKEEILIDFEKIIKPLVIAVFKNCLESLTLSQIRDALLPKLMSGKIRVPVEVKT